MNKFRKSFISATIMALCPLSTFAGEPDVTFLFKNGQKVSFAFTSRPKVIVNGDGVFVSSREDISTSYVLTDVQSFYFEENIQTGITDAKRHQALTFTYNNSVVTLSGLKSGIGISLFSTSGKLLGASPANEEGKACLDISPIPSGVYVITTTNGVSFKILKK